MGFLIVFLGSGIGGALRHGVNVLSAQTGAAFPFGTMGVNVLGSFLMGLIAGYFALKGSLPEGARLFLTTGILGGFTTFSAFSLDAVMLYQRGEIGAAAGYALGSVVLSILALMAGLAIVRGLMAA
jgi:CrcB protein